MVGDHVSRLVSRYRERGILVDTNLMVLLVVGRYDPERIGSFKRTAAYTKFDLELVHRLLRPFRRRVTTPHVLTEVDNIARQLPAREHGSLSAAMYEIAAGLLELSMPTVDLMSSPIYPRVGLTDAMIVATALELDCLVLTDDYPLANRLETMRRGVININHLRGLV